jgi:hypothetical protein
MTLGTMGAIATGLTLPIFNILFGRLTDELNKGNTDFTEVVNRLCIIIAGVSIANIITGMVQVISIKRSFQNILILR